VELLKLKSIDKVEQLAARADENHLSVQRLRETVNKEVVRSKSARGRKPIPAAMRAINLCVKALRDDLTGKLTVGRDDIDCLTDQQIEEARAMTDLLLKRVGELMKLLG